MNRPRCALLGLASILLYGSSVAHAAVGQLTCTSNTSAITANLSFFDLGLVNTLNVGSQSSGAGAGKITFSPLEIHTSLVNFQQFFQAVTTGAAFSTCTLAVKANGNNIDYTLKIVAVASVDAIARSPRTDRDKSASYLDVKLNYGAIEVKTNNGSDDGGSEGDWNVISNQAN
jgi:hypothetical protein